MVQFLRAGFSSKVHKRFGCPEKHYIKYNQLRFVVSAELQFGRSLFPHTWSPLRRD